GKVIVKNPSGELEVRKEQDQWRLVKPLQARADDQKVEDLIAQITTARIDSFLPDDAAKMSAYGLAEPRGTVSLFPQGDEKPIVFQVGAPSEKNKELIC